MHKLQRQPMKVDGREVVFHGSMKGGLTKIQPNKCKHDRGYVYASENIPLCVIFAVKRSGENVAFGVGKKGVTYIDEFYSGGFEDRFRGKKCYLYLLPKDQFECKTEFLEVVSEKPVDVLDCIEISDAAEYLLEMERKGQLEIGRYNQMSRRERRQIHDKLLATLKGYLDFKVLSQEEYQSLSSEKQKSYDRTLERYLFCKEKFADEMEMLNELELEKI